MAVYKPIKTSKTASQFSDEKKITVEATMNLMPDSKYKAGASYRVGGVGSAFSGTYKLRKVKHLFNSSGYSVEAEAIRTGTFKASTPKKSTSTSKPKPAAVSTGKTTTHIVKSGENLYTILKKYGRNPNAFKALASYNGIKNPDALHVGQKINIPANIK